MAKIMPVKAKGGYVLRPAAAPKAAAGCSDTAGDPEVDELSQSESDEEEDELDEDEDESDEEEEEDEAGSDLSSADESDESDSDESVTLLPQPTTPAPSHKRKSPALGDSSSKKPRASQGALALQAVGEQLNDFNDIMRSLVATEQGSSSGTAAVTLPSTPHRKQLAIRRAQELETDLLDDEVVSLLTIFEKDASAADAYLVLERPGVRKAWVARKLMELDSR
ncbi:hypothetical protein C8Q76DRAFT_696628 [Earliella scabrosa]|nr:hypothetical protein C8Q76DRAFT_696628 [Earliella scabrosa]